MIRVQDLCNISDMKEISIDGKHVRMAVIRSGFTKEQVVVAVQEKGFRFSLAGLDRVYKNIFPTFDKVEILKIIAKKCRCKLSDFSESESESA